MTPRFGTPLALLLALALCGCAGEGWYSPRTIDLSGTDGNGLWGVPGLDSDGDGIPDSVEGGDDVDTDGDGIPDYLDTDSDGDGTSDADEGDGDDDGDGIPNWLDSDDNTPPGDDDDDDDDDATGDDDDSTGDDDDATGDDDDSTGDDDDATGDDDDSMGDDDDSISGASISATSSVLDFGTVSPGTMGIATVTLTNSGGTATILDMTLTVTTTGPQLIWNITGGGFIFSLPANSTRTRFVEFTPPTGLPPAAYATDLQVDWDLNSGGPIVLTFLANTGATGESACSDNLDNDGDTFIDCDDSDCGADPVCNQNNDFCCAAGGGPVTSTQCQNSGVVSCVCAADSWCCDTTNGGWDQGCVDNYVLCGATCN